LPLSLVVALVGCAQPDLPTMLTRGSWVDLSYPFDSTTIYWPTARPFALEVVSAQRTAAGFYYAANNFTAAEHGGTHLDAPIHFAEGQRTTDQLGLDQLIGPAVVIDTKGAGEGEQDYLVTPDEVTAWESLHGAIPPGAIVLFRTGRGAWWPDRARILGTARLGPEAVAELHFPGLDPATARLLVERRVRAVGIDTPSIDFGQSVTFETHQVLAGANVPIFENVAGLDRLPVTGSFVVALPMKIGGGSGGPLRMAAWVPAGPPR
jgi:kynurenine formamidase